MIHIILENLRKLTSKIDGFINQDIKVRHISWIMISTKGDLRGYIYKV